MIELKLSDAGGTQSSEMSADSAHQTPTPGFRDPGHDSVLPDSLPDSIPKPASDEKVMLALATPDSPFTTSLPQSDSLLKTLYGS